MLERASLLHLPHHPLLSSIAIISPAMLLRRPQTPSMWKRPNPPTPDVSMSPLSPKRWLSKDSGAVGLGIVAALDNSIISDSLAKTILITAPVAIPSARPARRRIHESGRRQHKNSVDQRDGDFFCRSPATSCDKVIMPEFLSHCSMCRKRLHGKDIYMYTEKAFCSMECRYQQIVSDEVQEKCGKMSRISCPPCSGGGRLFFTGVAVA